MDFEICRPLCGASTCPPASYKCAFERHNVTVQCKNHTNLDLEKWSKKNCHRGLLQLCHFVPINHQPGEWASVLLRKTREIATHGYSNCAIFSHKSICLAWDELLLPWGSGAVCQTCLGGCFTVGCLLLASCTAGSDSPSPPAHHAPEVSSTSDAAQGGWDRVTAKVDVNCMMFASSSKGKWSSDARIVNWVDWVKSIDSFVRSYSYLVLVATVVGNCGRREDDFGSIRRRLVVN